MLDFVKANRLKRLRALLSDRTLTPAQLSKLKGGTGNTNTTTTTEFVTEEIMDL